jgi:hypothetical protein
MCANWHERFWQERFSRVSRAQSKHSDGGTVKEHEARKRHHQDKGAADDDEGCVSRVGRAASMGNHGAQIRGRSGTAGSKLYLFKAPGTIFNVPTLHKLNNKLSGLNLLRASRNFGSETENTQFGNDFRGGRNGKNCRCLRTQTNCDLSGTFYRNEYVPGRIPPPQKYNSVAG